jgi:hypothetical protein
MRLPVWLFVPMVAWVALPVKCQSFDSPSPAPSIIFPFHVFADKDSPDNHFFPSGWMGDYGDIRYDDGAKDNPDWGTTSIKITYTADSKQGAGWAGIYWQSPANNWGDKPGSYDLQGYKKLSFWARGEKGGEKIAEFKMGGITGEYSDSAAVTSGPVTLTRTWKKYSIDLAGKDLSRVVGGFGWSAKKDDTPDGMVFYLHNIRYE